MLAADQCISGMKCCSSKAAVQDSDDPALGLGPDQARFGSCMCACCNASFWTAPPSRMALHALAGQHVDSFQMHKATCAYVPHTI